jgi:Flp pilus assembly protein TadG
MRCVFFRTLERFGADRRAVSAVEFAIILPVLLLLLLGSFDVTRAVDAKSKSVLLSRTIADFVAQNQTITADQLSGIVAASKFVLYPYSDAADLLTIRIESVNKQPDNSYKIDWSYGPGTAKQSTDQVTTEPVPDASSIRTKVTYKYKLKFAGFFTNKIGFSEIVMDSTTNMSPRWGTPVTASGW